MNVQNLSGIQPGEPRHLPLQDDPPLGSSFMTSHQRELLLIHTTFPARMVFSGPNICANYSERSFFTRR